MLDDDEIAVVRAAHAVSRATRRYGHARRAWSAMIQLSSHQEDAVGRELDDARAARDAAVREMMILVEGLHDPDPIHDP